MRKSLLFTPFVLMVFFLISAQMSYAITYAQFALGGGYECLIFITNKTGSDWKGTIYISQRYNQMWEGRLAVNGEDLTGQVSGRISLDPNESAK